MTTTSRTFTVTPSPETVVEYLMDFAHAEEWDPGTETCMQITDGPIEVGTTWLHVSTITGDRTELEYTLEELAPQRIVLVGRSEAATSTDTIEVSPHGTGSEIRYTAELEVQDPTGPLPERLGDDTEEDLVRVLDRLS